MKSKPAPRHYSQVARAQSAEATGTRIVEAFLARLMQHWYDEITLDSVAEDAGVTVQTVVRRFGGKDGLLAAAVKVLAEQINAQRETPSGDLDEIVSNLLTDYEKTGDAVIRLLALEPRHPALKEFMDYGRTQHRHWVSSAFATAFSNLQPIARDRAVDTLVVATDVYTWKILRRDLGRSKTAVAATIKTLLQSALSELVQ